MYCRRLILVLGLSFSSALLLMMGVVQAHDETKYPNLKGQWFYTVQVNTSGDPTSTLLQNCAGSTTLYPDPSKFYLLSSANQIITTFDQITKEITKLYVAK